MNSAVSGKLIFIAASISSFIGWSVSIIGYIVNPQFAFELLSDLSGIKVDYNPILSYWLSMCSVAFAFIGLLFLLSINIRFKILRPILGAFNILMAVLLTIYCFRYGYLSDVQVYDSVFLITTGVVILFAGNSHHTPNQSLKGSGQ
jgi:hypothetical protein